MAERFRALLLAPVLVCLAAGLYGGLTRMGVFKPFFQQPMLHHGGLMVVGFLASLIALERYFGGGSWVAALSSLCFSLGGVALLFSGMVVNKVLWAAGSVSFLSWAFLNQYRFRTHFSTILFHSIRGIHRGRDIFLHPKQPNHILQLRLHRLPNHIHCWGKDGYAENI
jgi:hypothetical protein